MARKNQNHAKGRNSGKKFAGRMTFDVVDEFDVYYMINEDAKMFSKKLANGLAK